MRLNDLDLMTEDLKSGLNISFFLTQADCAVEAILVGQGEFQTRHHAKNFFGKSQGVNSFCGSSNNLKLPYLDKHQT